MLPRTVLLVALVLAATGLSVAIDRSSHNAEPAGRFDYELDWTIRIVGQRIATIDGSAHPVWEIERTYVVRTRPVEGPSPAGPTTLETRASDWYSPAHGVTVRSEGTQRETQSPTVALDLEFDVWIDGLEVEP